MERNVQRGSALLTLGLPYALIYAIEKDQCLVLAVAHLHRKPGYWHN